MEKLTIFTPAYNRKDLIHHCYESLKRQTCKNFKWIIIDDGSTDNTFELISKWQQEENDFKIEYYYKENGGLHTAYNEAIEHLDTELAMCIDSDDWMPDNAVELVLNRWDSRDSNEYAGIIGLDYDTNGNVIGDPLPNINSFNLIDNALGKYHLKWGDRKLAVRSDLYKSVAPMKIFEGEKNFNPNYLHMEISRNYNFLVLNECLCIVDYQDNGMSSAIYNQYYNSPRSFAELRKQHLSFEGISTKYKCKEYIHYISSCIIAKQKCGLENKNWLLFVLMIPFGVGLSMVIKLKSREK